MPKFWKRLLPVLAISVIAAGCAIFADQLIYRHLGYYDVDTDVRPVFTDGSEAIDIFGCEVTDGNVTVTGSDPQFAVETDGNEFSKVQILFREPAAQNTSLQVFYWPFSEENSVRRTIAAGMKEETVSVPANAYRYLRFDFEKDVSIDKIYIGNEERVMPQYEPHPIRLGVVFSVIFIPGCICFIVKACKRKDDHRKGKEN